MEPGPVRRRTGRSIVPLHGGSFDLVQKRFVGAVAGVDDRFVLRAAGRLSSKMFPAVFAFVAEADAGRAGEFHGDPPPGTVTKNDPRQDRDDGEKKVKDDGRDAEQRPSRSRPPACFHGNMIAPTPLRVNYPYRPPSKSAIRMFLLSRRVPIDRSKSAWAMLESMTAFNSWTRAVVRSR